MFSIGLKGLVDELELLGVEVKSSIDFISTELDYIFDFADIKVDEDITAVVVGWDMYLNYYTLCYASICL